MTLAFLFWLSRVITFSSAAPAEVELLEERIAGRGDHAAGYGRDAEATGHGRDGGRDADVIEPQLGICWRPCRKPCRRRRFALDAIEPPVFTTNVGRGMGDQSPARPLGEGDEIIPRGERWEIRYGLDNVAAYASSWTSSRLNCCAGRRQKQIDYAQHLQKSSPDRRQGDRAMRKTPLHVVGVG